MRLLRERIVASLLLSAAGGIVGMLLAWGALQWLVHARQDMNRIEAIHIDGTVAAFTIGMIAFCALFSGLISALSFQSRHVLATLQESSRAHSAGTGRARLRRILLVLQVGLTVVLLIGAGLLLKSFQRMRRSDIGVPVDNVLTMRISLPEGTYPKPEQWVAFFEKLIARVRADPAVFAAVAGALLVIAALACIVPAWRAAQLDPIQGPADRITALIPPRHTATQNCGDFCGETLDF